MTNLEALTALIEDAKRQGNGLGADCLKWALCGYLQALEDYRIISPEEAEKIRKETNHEQHLVGSP